MNRQKKGELIGPIRISHKKKILHFLGQWATFNHHLMIDIIQLTVVYLRTGVCICMSGYVEWKWECHPAVGLGESCITSVQCKSQVWFGGFGGYLGGKLQILGWRFSHHISQVYCREQTHNVDISLFKVVYLYVLRKDSMDVLNIYLMPTVWFGHRSSSLAIDPAHSILFQALLPDKCLAIARIHLLWRGIHI